jgi:signal transduction histidine kinase
VNNAVRHSEAHTIGMTLRAQDGGLSLVIRDDGKGIVGPLDDTGGLGIRVMRNRAAVIGRILGIGPAAAGGTIVTCTLPEGRSRG